MATRLQHDLPSDGAPVVSDAQVAEFRREGILRIDLRAMLGDAAIDDLRRAYDRAEAGEMPGSQHSPWNDSREISLHFMHCMYKYFPECAAIALSAKIGELAARLAGVDHVRLLYDQIMLKRPGMDATPWHQDMPFLPFSRRGHLAIWIAVDDLDENMGLTRYLPRSHRIGALPRALPYDPKKIHLMSDEEVLRGRPSEDVRTLLRDDDFEIVGDVVSFPLRSGEAIVHDGMLVHGASANTSDRIRRVHQITLIPADTQYNGMPYPDTDGLGLIPYGPFDHPNFPVIY